MNGAESLVGFFLANCRLHERQSGGGDGDGEYPVEHDGLPESKPFHRPKAILQHYQKPRARGNFPSRRRESSRDSPAGRATT